MVMRNLFSPSFQEKFDFGDVIDLACMPAFKMLQASCSPNLQNGKVFAPTSGDKSWLSSVEASLEYLEHSPLLGSISEQVSVACLDQGKFSQNGSSYHHQTIKLKAYLKGLDASKFVENSTNYKKLQDKVLSKHRAVAWNPIDDCVSIRTIDEQPLQSKQLIGKFSYLNTMSTTVLTNNTQLCNQLSAMVESATTKLRNKAYLQHYTKFGLEADFLHDRIEMVRAVKDDYVSALY